MNEAMPLTSEAVNYSWRQLAQRAGIIESNNLSGTGFEKLGLQVYYDQPENVKKEHPCLIVVPCSHESWQSLLERSSNSLDWFLFRNVVPRRGSSLLFDDPIPVLFWGYGYESSNKPFAEKKDNKTIIIYADIVASTFFMLSRWEESVIGQRDKHGRFSATSSVAFRQGFLHLPVVDYWGKILGEWIKSLLPTWRPSSKKFRVLISHDIDHPLRYSTWNRVVRDFLWNAVSSNLRKSYQQIATSYRSRRNWKIDPYYMGIRMLVKLNEKYGFDSHFYFQASEPGHLNTGYPVYEEPYRSIIKDVHNSGFEIGIHASYRSFDEPDQLIIEKTRLEEVIKEDIHGGRQHYLRFRAPHTWRNWEAAGLDYDSTLGYADQIGFRAGTSIPYNPFDFKENRILSITEIPLLVMDHTLKDYQKTEQEVAFEEVVALARRSKIVGGLFTLVWHNHSFYGHSWKKWRTFYNNLLQALVSM